MKTWELPGLLSETATCPRKLITEESFEWLDLYEHYKRGVLLFSGGLMDQPSIYIEAMTLIQRFAPRG